MLKSLMVILMAMTANVTFAGEIVEWNDPIVEAITDRMGGVSDSPEMQEFTQSVKDRLAKKDYASVCNDFVKASDLVKDAKEPALMKTYQEVLGEMKDVCLEVTDAFDFSEYKYTLKAKATLARKIVDVYVERKLLVPAAIRVHDVYDDTNSGVGLMVKDEALVVLKEHDDGYELFMPRQQAQAFGKSVVVIGVISHQLMTVPSMTYTANHWNIKSAASKVCLEKTIFDEEKSKKCNKQAYEACKVPFLYEEGDIDEVALKQCVVEAVKDIPTDAEEADGQQ